MSAHDPAWQFFAALHGEADPRSIDRSLARDEALDVVLNETLVNSRPDQDLVRKRFFSLCRNRLTKLRHRRALDRGRFRATHRRGGKDFGNILLTAPARGVLDQIACRQLTDLIRTVLPEDDFMLLMEIGDGCPYAEMARDRRITVSSLKSRAFRIREKVRKSGVAAVLAHGLRH